MIVNWKSMTAAGAIALFAGCATTHPPQELTAARGAFQRARGSPASQYAPSKLYEAKKALDTANTAYQHNPGARDVKDLAYIAERKAEYAQVEGRTEQLRREKASLNSPSWNCSSRIRKSIAASCRRPSGLRRSRRTRWLRRMSG